MQKTTLCLITRNELQGLKRDFPKINRNEFLEVIAIDGNSSDGTFEYLSECGIDVYQQLIPGLNNAYIMANEKAKGHNIIIFFPKGTVDIKIINEIKLNLTEDFDIVIASRLIKNSVNEEDGKLLKIRKWGVKALSIIISVLWRKKGQNKIHDVLHGIKGWKVESFKTLNINNSGFTIDLEMILKGYKNNLKMKEIPAIEIERFYGKTNFKIIPTSWGLFKYLIYEIKQKFHN